MSEGKSLREKLMEKAIMCLEATKEEYHCDLECLSWDNEGNEVFDFNECGNVDCKILLTSIVDACKVAEDHYKQMKETERI